jgi:succinate-semialdehyde dehydrogenase/glutarate-semialdehyde dehydrogenase
MKLDANLDFAADMGSLASEAQLRRVEEHIEDAVSKGAKVLAGGKRRPDIGPYFFEPTILENTSEGMALFREETFGPVAALFRFESEDDAIKLANDSDFGLNFSVWTRDAGRGRLIASRLEAGMVGVNDAYASAWSATDSPMGGFKDSGVGRRHGSEGILKYTEAQNVSTQRVEVPVGDAERYAKFATAALKIMRRLPRGR